MDNSSNRRSENVLRTAVGVLAWLSMFSVQAAPLSGASLVQVLQKGGYVLVVRHASSTDAPPTAKEADSGNTTRERQLDATGRKTAQAMGAAIHSLHIPVGKVLSSPTYRAKQTVQLAGLGKPTIFTQLGDAGHSMERGAVASQVGRFPIEEWPVLAAHPRR